ncbi:hypothetical protein Tco_0236889 [Tanacetum coccineum]
MGRDIIQLEDAVSTILQEYLLEFLSEYFISENLHPELPGPGDHIVDFPEGKIGVYTKKIEFANFRIPIWQFLFDILGYYQIHLSQLSVIEMDLFNLLKAPNPTKVKTGTRQRTAHEVSLLTATTSCVIQMVDATELSTSSGTPSTVERSPLDFSKKDAPPPPLTQGAKAGVHGPTAAEQEIPVTDHAGATEAAVAPDLEKEVISLGPTIKKRRRQRDAGEGGSNATAKVLREDHDAARAEHIARGGKSLTDMSVDTELAIHIQETHEPPVAMQSVSDPDPFSYAKPQSKQDVAQSSKEEGVAGNQDSEKSTPSPSITGSPGSIYQLGWGVPNSCRLDTPKACQDVVDHIAPSGYFSELRHLPNDEFFSQYNINLARQVAMGSQLRLTFEQEAKLLRKFVAQVTRRDQRIATREKHIKDLEAQLEAEINMKKSAEAKNSEVIKELEDLQMRFLGLEVGNAQISQQVSVLQAQVMGEKRIMAAFEDFKKHEDERVNARCAEIDARLDALSVDFDEELYPHMLTAIFGRRWVIGYGLRLAVMKCAESTELRQAFANVVSARIAKGMSKGLKYGVEHGKAGLELIVVEAYDPEADNKYVVALHDLKDLNYPLIDELEQLKDAPLDIIMASLYLDSHTGEDAPQFIHDLRPSSSQLKIPVYPEVRNPRNPWACKDEILLEDAIAANISRAEKKKKSRVICRTHGVGSAHHARSDGIPVSVPTVAPQGLQILLADAATQTEDEESPRLLRSKSLPAMFNLDWP